MLEKKINFPGGPPAMYGPGYLVPLFWTAFVQNISQENKFDLNEKELVGGAISKWMVSHEELFRHRGNSNATQQWPIAAVVR